MDLPGPGEVWAAARGRLEELLTFLDSAEPEPTRTLSALEGVALLLHLAAGCSSPLRYRHTLWFRFWFWFWFFTLSLFTVLVLPPGFPLRLWAGLCRAASPCWRDPIRTTLSLPSGPL